MSDAFGASCGFVRALGKYLSLQQDMAIAAKTSPNAEPICARLGDLIDRIAFDLCDTPATSVVECAVKATVLIDYIAPPEDLSGQLAQSLCQDLIRIAHQIESPNRLST